MVYPGWGYGPGTSRGRGKGLMMGNMHQVVAGSGLWEGNDPSETHIATRKSRDHKDFIGGFLREKKIFSPKDTGRKDTISVLEVKDCSDLKDQSKTNMPFHTLRKSTTDVEISTWCSQTLVQIIQQRRMQGDFYMPYVNLVECPPAVLRKVVVTIRDEMVQGKISYQLRSKMGTTRGVFHKRTKRWEIEAYEVAEVRIIYTKFLSAIRNRPEYKQYSAQVTVEDMKQVLISATRDMFERKMKEVNVVVELPFFDGNLKKKLDQIEFHQIGGSVENPKDPIKMVVKLTENTTNEEIQKWNLEVIVQLLRIWKAYNRFMLKVDDLTSVSAKDLRKMLCDVRDRLDINDIPSVQVRVVYTQTLYANMKEWEVNAYTMSERFSLLDALYQMKGISQSVQNMTNEALKKAILTETSAEWFISKPQGKDIIMPMSAIVTQDSLDGPDNTKLQIRKDSIVYPQQLSKDTDEEEVWKWSLRVLVDFLIKIHGVQDNDKKWDLMLTSAEDLRKQILVYLHRLKQDNNPVIHVSTITNPAFFSKDTKDWEIKQFDIEESRYIYTKHYAMVYNCLPPKEVMKLSRMDFFHELSYIRDEYMDSKKEFEINLSSMEDMEVEMGNLQPVTQNALKRKRTPLEPHEVFVTKNALCPYRKRNVITQFTGFYTNSDESWESSDSPCVPVLRKTTSDFTILTWKISIKKSVLQEAGVDLINLHQNDYTNRIFELRANMESETHIKATVPNYGFLMPNTRTSTIAVLSKEELVQSYSYLCYTVGITVPKGLSSLMSKADIVEEMHLIRALKLTGQCYYFDLLLEVVQSDRIDSQHNEVKRMLDAIEQRIKRLHNLDSSLAILSNKSSNKDKDLMVLEMDHISWDMNDDVIVRQVYGQAVKELSYQLQLDSTDDFSSFIEGLTYPEILRELLKVRNRYFRIYESFNNASETESTDSLDDNSTTEEQKHDSPMESQFQSFSQSQSDNREFITSDASEGMVITQEEDRSQAVHQITPKKPVGNRNILGSIPEQNTNTGSQVGGNIITPLKQTDHQQNHEGITFGRSATTVTAEDQDDSLDNNEDPYSGENHQAKQEITSFQEFGENQENLRGMDVMKVSRDNSKVSGSEISVKEIKKHFFFLRVKLATDKDSTHIPSLVQKFFKVLREVDSTFQILPFADVSKSKAFSDRDIITNEDQLPDEVAPLEKWIKGIEVDWNRKLNFSMRVTNSMPFKDLRATTKNWCKKNDCEFTFDNIFTEQIFRAGWLRGVHPRYHDRDAIKVALTQQYPVLKDRITIYPRMMWVHPGKGKKVIETDGLAIDGDFKYKTEILKALYAIRWTCTKYPKALFVPLKATRGCSLVHQVKFFNAHIEYLKNTYTKVIELRENFNFGSRQKPIWFTDWMENFSKNGAKVFDKAELFDHKCVRVIYHKNNEHAVQEIVAHLFSTISDLCGAVTAEQLLGDEQKYIDKKAYFRAESTYNRTCNELAEGIEIQETADDTNTNENSHSKKRANRNKSQDYAGAVKGNKKSTLGVNDTQQNEIAKEINQLKQMVDNNMKREEAFRREMDRRMGECVEDSKVQVQQHIDDHRTEVKALLQATVNTIDKKIERKEGEMVQQISALQQLIITTQKANTESTAQMILNSQAQLMESIASINTRNTPRDVELSSVRGVRG